jgi:hypothetical protein
VEWEEGEKERKKRERESAKSYVYLILVPATENFETPVAFSSASMSETNAEGVPSDGSDNPLIRKIEELEHLCNPRF